MQRKALQPCPTHSLSQRVRWRLSPHGLRVRADASSPWPPRGPPVQGRSRPLVTPTIWGLRWQTTSLKRKLSRSINLNVNTISVRKFEAASCGVSGLLALFLPSQSSCHSASSCRALLAELPCKKKRSKNTGRRRGRHASCIASKRHASPGKSAKLTV